MPWLLLVLCHGLSVCVVGVRGWKSKTSQIVLSRCPPQASSIETFPTSPKHKTQFFFSFF